MSAWLAAHCQVCRCYYNPWAMSVWLAVLNSLAAHCQVCRCYYNPWAKSEWLAVLNSLAAHCQVCRCYCRCSVYVNLIVGFVIAVVSTCSGVLLLLR